MMTILNKEPRSLEILQNDFNGDIILPEDAEYDERRQVWNGLIDKKPKIIAKCLGTADVIKALKFARTNNLELAIRGGGHNVAGTAVCDGGIVIDLSAMRGVWVHPDSKVVRVQGGALWSDVDYETQLHGLATPGGVVSHTGVAGLTLGGGIGWLMRKQGLTIDNLISAEVVLANGNRVTASKTTNPELFWALRGGGGNFGIVTSFEFKLHPVGPKVIADPLIWRKKDASKVLQEYREIVYNAPQELGTIIRFGTISPSPEIPEHLHFEPSITINTLFTGSVERGRKVLKPLREIGTPLLDMISPKLYTNHQRSTDQTVLYGWHYYWKS